MGGKGWGGNFDWGFVWGCIPVNAQGALWDCKCIPVNAQGDQKGCIVSGDGPGVQRDWVGVCVCVWGGWRKTWVQVYSSIFYILSNFHTKFRVYVLYFCILLLVFYFLWPESYMLYLILYPVSAIFNIVYVHSIYMLCVCERTSLEGFPFRGR